MTIAAVSFRSESGDHYLSLFTDIDGPIEFADRLQEEFGDEFSYLYVNGICTDDGTESALKRELLDRIEQAQEGDDFYG